MNALGDAAHPTPATNPPGRTALTFRLATQPVFLQWMLRRLRQRMLILPNHTRLPNPLQGLNVEDPRAFVPSLLSAWATVGDVLTFYQERIVNEGYLATAVESLSVRELVTSVGYLPRPALSATTYLAFTLIDAREANQPLPIPKGAVVRSIPSQGESSVLFETHDDIEARPAWNAMVPFLTPPKAASQIVGLARQVRVAGAISELRPGMPILLHGTARDSGRETAISRELSAVEPDALEGATLLRWDEPLKGPKDQTLLDAADVLLFRQSARLFGATAPDWKRQPASVQAQYGTRVGPVAVAPLLASDWAEVSAGLPPGNIGALAVDDGKVLAAVEDAVLSHTAESGWRPTGTIPHRGIITALTAPGQGVLYVGNQRGEVFCSTNHGVDWFALVGSSEPAPPKGAMARLPAGPVRSLAVAPEAKGVAAVLAATVFGIWRTSSNGGNWAPWNAGLPGYDAESGSAAVGVNDLARDPGSGRWIAATDQGVFYAHQLGGTWHSTSHARFTHPSASPAPSQKRSWGDILGALHLRRPVQVPLAPSGDGSATPPAPTSAQPPAASAPAVHAVAILPGGEDTILFAATEEGVLRSNLGRQWRPVGGLPGDAEGLAITHLAAGGTVLLAGTSKGLFQSRDEGETWTRVGSPFAEDAVAALAVGGGLQVVAASFGGYQETEWPNFSVQGAQIDLDRAYTALVPGSWVVLAQDGEAGRRFDARKVVSASVVQRHDFQSSGRVTRIVVDPPATAAFDPRTTTAFIYSRALDLFDRREPSVTILGADLEGDRTPAQAAAARTIKVADAVEDVQGHFLGISGRRAGMRLVGRAGGVRTWDERAGTWSPAGSANYDAQALLVTRDGRIVIGTKTGAYVLEGDDWHKLGPANGTGALSEKIETLVETSEGVIVAAGEAGIWQLVDGQWTARARPGQKRPIRTLLVLDSGHLAAGTDVGIYTTGDGGLSWESAAGAIMSVEVGALAHGPRGILLAGSSDGVFIASGGDWASATHKLQGLEVHALATADNDRLYAATSEGLFFTRNAGRTWLANRSVHLLGDIRALAVHPESRRVYAARRGVGVVTANEALPAGIANDVRALSFDSKGILYAGSLSSSFLLAADSRIVALEPQRVTDIDDGAELVSGLVDGSLAPDLRHILARNNVVLPDKAQVRVEQRSPPPPGSPPSATGHPTIWSIGDGGTISYFLHAIGTSGIRVFLESDLTAMAPPQPHPERAGLTIWRLRTSDRIEVTLTAAKGEIAFTTADASGETVAEVQRIDEASITADRTWTTLVLSCPLANVYDATTVAFNANVAPASHGETSVLYEVIGNGDNSQANQSFALKRKPLTALSSTSAPGYEFAVTVYVRPSLPSEPIALSGQLRPRSAGDQAIPWSRVQTLQESGPNDRSYTLHEDDAGRAIVTFGDGIHGARLPTGTENVIALYRTGSGPDGNVDAGTLTVPLKRPAGVRKVTNPTAATGGTLREASGSMRRIAPITTRGLGRVVSLRDYDDFVRTWPGIAKAATQLIPLSGRKSTTLIQITVASTDGKRPDNNVTQPSAASAHDDLVRAITCNCATPHRVRIDDCVQRRFKLEADLAISPGYEWTPLCAAIRAVLRARYGFAERGLAEPVHAADLVACMQDIRGVRAVNLTALYLRDGTVGRHETLAAAPAHRIEDTDVIRPAELLLLDSDGDIVLTRSPP